MATLDPTSLRQAVSVTVLLVLLVLLVAAAGGFLGDLLQFAGLLIAMLVVAGALAGLGLWLLFRRLFTPR